ncbi:CopG family transcriptional regulator [Paraconexibacter sp.]|uniref:ribbon-helix-helix domain-containing protein n=1 Tax=Paraconexibacter sp. TaxID=2949640 RepID=UPI0035673016
MKKTSLYLDPELDAALARRAEDEGLSKAEYIRRTLEGSLTRPKRIRPRAVGVVTGDGLPADLSARDEEYLASDVGR